MQPDRSPGVALALGLLVPGGGHGYAGRLERGIACFLVVSALTAVGWALTGPAFLTQYRYDISFGTTRIGVPIAIPEVLNFLETWLAQAWLGAADTDTAWKSTAPLGSVLTSTGALFNLFAACEAHALCRKDLTGGGAIPAFPHGAKSPAVAALLAWVAPGAGHWWLGRRTKGLLAGAVLTITLVLGVFFAHGTVVQRERDQYFWSGEILLGAPAALATVLLAGRRVLEDLPLAELGLLCATVAGLLNVLLMLDAYGTAERDLLQAKTPSKP